MRFWAAIVLALLGAPERVGSSYLVVCAERDVPVVTRALLAWTQVVPVQWVVSVGSMGKGGKGEIGVLTDF